MLGVILISSATSAKVPTEFSTEEIEGLFTSVGGCMYMIWLVLVILICVVIIIRFEEKYPLEMAETQLNDEIEGECDWQNLIPPAPRPRGSDVDSTAYPVKRVRRKDELWKVPEPASYQRKGTKKVTFEPLKRSVTMSFQQRETAPLARFLTSFNSFYVKPNEVLKNNNVPNWLDNCMLIIYPGSLGLDEGIAHLSMKAYMALLSQCGTTGTCGEPILWLMVLLWLVSSLATLWWMRTVFKRYETTKALPIEYGVVMAVNAMSGLIFYNESDFMETSQVILMAIGVLVVVIGIAVGSRENEGNQSKDANTRFRENMQILEPVEEAKNESLYARKPKKAVRFYPVDKSRSTLFGYGRDDAHSDDELYPSINGGRAPNSGLSFKDLTISHGVDLPEMSPEVNYVD